MARLIHVWNLYEVVAGYMNGDKARRESTDNVMETKYYLINGVAYPRVSAQMYRHALRKGMTDVSGRDYLSIFTTLKDFRLKEGVHFQDSVLQRKFFEDYPGNLVFGYLITKEKKVSEGNNGGFIKRQAPVNNTHLLGLTEKRGNTVRDFIRAEHTQLTGEAKKKAEKGIAQKELVSTVYSGSMVISIPELSVVQPYERTFRFDESIEPLDFSDEVKEHIANVIKGMFAVRDFADSTRSLVDSSPVMTIVAITDKVAHRFANPFKLIKNNGKGITLNVERINELVSDYYGKDSVIVAGMFGHKDPLIDLTGMDEVEGVHIDVSKYPAIEDKLSEEVLKRL